MKRFAIATAVLALCAVSLAVEVAGVRMPETVTVEGKTLKLNGAGLRTKLMFKVYVAGLYAEAPSRDPAVLIASDQTKSMRLIVLRGLTGSKIAEGIAEGFRRNSKREAPALAPRLDRLGAMIPNVAKGDEIVMTYVPARGTVVRVQGVEKGVIEGKDFADALLSVWLGANPVQEDLKKALLGG
jgi:hypothetical protein